MSALPVQVKISFFVFVKIYTPADQFIDLCRGLLYNAFHYADITQPCPRIERVCNVFFKIVPGICYRSNAALCIVSVGIF